MLNYNHLHYFYITAKHGSVSRAAQILKIQQPSLSAQLKTFEKTLDQKLFEKVGRNLKLTAQGLVAYRYCQKIYESADQLEHYLGGRHSLTESEHSLKIGVTEQIDQPFIADLISHVLSFSSSSSLRLEVISGTHGELVQKTKNSDVDLIFTNSPVLDQSLSSVIEIKMPVGLFASTQLIQRKKIKDKMTLKSWFNETSLGLILPAEGLRLRHETEAFLEKYKLHRTVVFQSDMLAVVCRAVVEGIGLSFLPIPYMIEEVDHHLVQLISSPQGLWSHQLYVTGRKLNARDSAIQKIKKALEHLKKSQKFN